MQLLRSRIVAAVCAALGLLFSGLRAQAQEMPKPGPEHARLAEQAGDWDAVIKIRPAPNAPFIEAKGTYTSRMGLGGFWLISEFKGEFMGQPMQGRGMDGYDQYKKKYVGAWFDSMSSAFMATEGEMDRSGKVLTMQGEGPNMEGKPTKYKIVTEMKDKDTMLFSMYEGGEKEPSMTITYKRKK